MKVQPGSGKNIKFEQAIHLIEQLQPGSSI
jgi:hypothetical protein